MTTTPTIHLGVPTQAGPLTVFPVWTDAPLPEKALRARLPKGATIDELPDGSEVEYLTVHNPTPKTFLLPGGSIFDGGLQHRALVHSVVVDAHSDLTIDVRCVEQGRWGGRKTQQLHRRRAPLAVRGALRGVSADRVADDPDLVFADQTDVWSRVHRYEASAGPSVTSSLVEMTDRLEPAGTDALGELRPLLGQRGVLIGVGGHPAVLEIFDHPRTLADQWDAILTSVVADARLAPARSTSGARARTFVNRVSRRQLAGRDRAGAAVAASARDDLAVIDATVAEAERIVHLAALNARHQLVGAG